MYKGQRHYLLIVSQYIGGRPQVKVFRGCSLMVGRKRGPILRFSLKFLWRKINCWDVWHKNYSFNFIANNTVIVIVLVWIALITAASAFPQFFFFFSATMVDPFFCEQCICALFTDPTNSTFYQLFIKNGSHSTIHTFKNYFATVFSVFSFQFQQNKFYPNRPIISRACSGSNYTQGEEIFLRLRTLEKIMSKRPLGIPGLRYNDMKLFT